MTLTREKIAEIRDRNIRTSIGSIPVNKDDLSALLALAEQALDIQPRPIAEAKRDGTPVLLKLPVTGKDCWQTGRFVNGVWAISLDKGVLHYFDADRPTHFIPLSGIPIPEGE